MNTHPRRRGGALRALLISTLIAFVVAYGGCIAYEATLRTELEGVRVELEAEGAILDLDEFADTLERGDPRTAEFLRSVSQLPRVGSDERAAFETRVAALGSLDLRGELEQALARADRGEVTFPQLDLPLAAYFTLVENVGAELLDAAMAGDTDGYEGRVALAVRLVELLDGDAILLGYAARSSAQLELLKQVETALGLLPTTLDLGVLEAHLAGLEPRALLERAFEGERAYGLDMLSRSSPQVVPRVLFGGELRRLQLERDYYVAMAECFVLLRLPWPELQLQRPRRPRRGIYMAPPEGMRALLPRVESQVSTALQIQARRDLALAALAARGGGHAAAITLLAERSDPFTGKPYAAEVGADGFLRLASAGPDTVLVPGEWPATREENVDDLRWLLAPEATGD